MNHEVEYDVHVKGARSENTEPVYLKKHGPRDQGHGGAHGWIEALEVTDLGDAARFFCHCD